MASSLVSRPTLSTEVRFGSVAEPLSEFSELSFFVSTHFTLLGRGASAPTNNSSISLSSHLEIPKKWSTLVGGTILFFLAKKADVNLLTLLPDMRKSLTEVDPSANSKGSGAVVIFVCFRPGHIHQQSAPPDLGPVEVGDHPLDRLWVAHLNHRGPLLLLHEEDLAHVPIEADQVEQPVTVELVREVVNNKDTTLLPTPTSSITSPTSLVASFPPCSHTTSYSHHI